MTGHPHPGKRSEWFPAALTPNRIGWYEIRFETKIQWRFFDGLCWLLSECGPASFFGINDVGQWRGLAEKPE